MGRRERGLLVLLPAQLRLRPLLLPEGAGAREVRGFLEALASGNPTPRSELDYGSPYTLLVAVGGGGLIGGVAAWYEGGVKIVGVEPEAAPTLWNALRAGRPVDSEAGGIAADSLAPKRVGELMFPIAQKYVERVVLVPDEAIQNAQRTLWQALRIAAEPGGAAAFAALISGRYQPGAGERGGVLVCGGNTSAVDFG